MSSSAAMPRYQSVKKVWALEVKRIDGNTVYFMDAARFMPKDFAPEVFARYRPEQGDFMVQYEDGYWSVSPRAAFLSGYVHLPHG